jgi:DNA sulfur modification protein DndD
VILDELVLKNVGTFAGKQTITLTPPSPSKPVVLIGGLNGAGKTTILEAIHLALYGALAQPSGRRSGSYDNYLRSLIHHGVSADDGAMVELTFHAYQQGEKHSYRIRRAWRGNGNSLREIPLVWVDGKFDQALTETWSEHVETFLPRGIAGLFFFDGEQIEALADLDRSREVLGSALAALLGLDLVDRLATDLAVLRRRHRGADIPDELRLAVEEHRERATAIRQSEETAAALAASATVEAERANKRLHEVTERYRAAGGGLLDQREAAETRVAMMREQIRELDEVMRREAAEVAPFLQVAPLLSGLATQVAAERDASRERVVLDAVTDRDQLILDQLRTAKVKITTLTAIERFLASDVSARQESTKVPDVSGTSGQAPIKPLLAVLSPLRSRLDDLITRRRSLEDSLAQAERAVVAIPDAEALAPLRAELDDAERESVRCHALLAQAEEQLRALRDERARADSAYETALDKSAQASLAADDDRRLVEHIERVRTTLEAVKIEAAERHLARIADLVLDALNQLMRKESLVTGLRIDPVDYTVELTGAGGRPLTTKAMSAGERQLLAVALLWGLARAAGQPLPMVVDTPLGRLDSAHRSRLVERYFPYASHQVVLLSTDTEIDEEAYHVLHSKVGRSYCLEFDSDANATTIVPGYFWE